MSAHTPAPWTLQPCSNGGVLLRRGDQLGPGMHEQCSLQIFPEADAHLMAAAPDLLAALKGLMELREAHFSPDDYAWESRVKDAYAAIAKAEGATK